MPITETPKVIYKEINSNPILKGNGAQIPVFIGNTGNKTPVEGIQRFKNYTAARRTVENGGIGLDPETNSLLNRVKEFFEETRKTAASEITAPYVYVVDLGEASLADTKMWTDAMEIVKSKRDIQVEVFCGITAEEVNAEGGVTKMVALMESAYTSIIEDSATGNPRIGYFTVDDISDEDIMKLTSDDETTYIQQSRIVLAEPTSFGKIIGKICTTPSDEEPGYTDFRSIMPGIFNKRTPEQELELQNAGIIFIRDELAGSNIHPKIDLSVSTAFAKQPDLRPNDALLHARRNVDQLVRDVYEVLYAQLKRNETETNLSYLQSSVDVLVQKYIDKGSMMEGTEINVIESDIEPYDLAVEGAAVPVNITALIGFQLYVEAPNITVTGGN